MAELLTMKKRPNTEMTTKLNTVFMLMAEFGTAAIPLDVVAERYLGIGKTVASTRAARSELPFPAFRADSQKAPWLVSVSDLAAWLDREMDKAADDWKKRNVA